MNFEKKKFFQILRPLLRARFFENFSVFQKTVKKINISKTREGIKISSDKSLRIHGIYFVSKFGGHSLSRFCVMCNRKKC